MRRRVFAAVLTTLPFAERMFAPSAFAQGEDWPQRTDVIASMKAGGFEPGAVSPAEVDAFIKAEHKRWGEVVRATGIKPQ